MICAPPVVLKKITNMKLIGSLYDIFQIQEEAVLNSATVYQNSFIMFWLKTESPKTVLNLRCSRNYIKQLQNFYNIVVFRYDTAWAWHQPLGCLG